MRFLLIFLILTAFPVFAADPLIPQPDVSFFTTLRMDYSKRKDFSPMWKLENDRVVVIAGYKAKDYKKAFELSERWLARCPVDADIHTTCSAAAMACRSSASGTSASTVLAKTREALAARRARTGR